MVVRACPLCGESLEEKRQGRPRLECPSCRHQIARCPCGGDLVKEVVPGDGVTIEEGGLPLERCWFEWRCARCGRSEPASLDEI